MSVNHRSRVLLVSAMPRHPTLSGEGGAGSLFHVGSKTRALAHRLRPVIEQGQVSLVVEHAVRANQLVRLLKAHRPHVVHLVCHGASMGDGRRALVLEGRGGEGELFDAGAIRDAFGRAGWTPQLLITEACGSLPVVDELVASGVVGAAVGVRDSIDPQASTRFFITFHAALGSGCDVREAFGDARRDLELLAPSIWDLPVLVERKNGLDQQRLGPVVASSDPDELEIDPSRAEDLVLLAGPRTRSASCLGRGRELEDLDGGLASATTSIIHLRGAVGVGKTTVLSRWLDELRRRRFRGTTRVLSWSFDTRAGGPGGRGVDEFLEEALDFFGALEPTLIATRHDAVDRGQWLDGLRLGRCLRHQRVLVCLDAVPLLPHRPAEALPPQRLYPPGIAALLLELSRGGLATCVVASRAGCGLGLDGVEELELGPLSEADAVELLLERKVLARVSTLEQLARSCGGHPGRLAIVGDAATASTAWISGGPPPSPTTVLEQLGDNTLVEGLVAGGGELHPDELRAVMGPDEMPRQDPAWAGLREATVGVLCRARSMGVVRVTDAGSVALAQDAWIEDVVPSSATYAVVGEQRRRRVGSPLERVDQAPVFQHAVRNAVRGGAPEQAVETYVELVCRRGRDQYEQSYLARKLGGVAEELSIVAELFEPGAKGELVGETLRPGIADAEPPGGAFFFHRLGLALRHLGSLRDSVMPLRRAFELYDGAGAGFEERAATCANDLAEVHASRGELEVAFDCAQSAVARADRASDGGIPLERALLAQFLCRATLGHVYHRRGQEADAAEEFERAEALVKRYRAHDSEQFQRLFSRPGYQQWGFLLGRIARRLARPPEGDGPSSTVEALVEQLLEHLRYAEAWAAGRKVARVSRSYHLLARGRLGLLLHGHQAPPGDGDPWLRRAQRDLFAAVHVLRANQHLWMLAEALEARAELFEALNDPVSAELDRTEAGWLSQLLHT